MLPCFLFLRPLCNRFQFMFQQSRSLALPPRSSSFHSPIHFSPYVIRDIMVAAAALARHQRHKEKKQRSHCGHQQTDKSQAARGKGSLSLGFGSDTVVLNGIKATGNPLSHLSERKKSTQTKLPLSNPSSLREFRQACTRPTGWENLCMQSSVNFLATWYILQTI